MRKPSAFVSVRTRILAAALALAALPLAAHAVEVPATAVTADTVLVAFVDVGAVDSKDVTEQLAKFQAKMAGASAVDAKQKEQAQKLIKALVDLRTQFVAAGGEGILLGMAQPAKEGDKPEPFLLLKSKAGADRAKFEKMIQGLSDLAKDNNQAATALLSAKVEKYGASTEWHAVTADELAAPPLNGNAKEAAVFNAALKAAGNGSAKNALEACFRMSSKMKADLKAQLDAQAKNPDQADMDMMTAMMGGVMQPLVSLDTVTMVGQGGKGARQVVLAGHFSDAKSAKEFAGSANGVLEMLKGMVGMQVVQMAKHGVDQKNAQEVMGAFAFKEAGSSSVLTLDDAFFTKLETLVDQMQAAQAKMSDDRQKHGNARPVAGDEGNAQGEGDDDAKVLDSAENANAK